MFKRILKIIGITLAICLGAGGLGVGIYALSGGFKNEVINIQALYFSDETETTKVQYTLEDVEVTINCTPKNATDKTLELAIIDDVGVLENAPKTVTAGVPFKLQIRKDADGNNVGGVVNITATKGTGFAKYTLISDVAIPNGVVFFAGDDDIEEHPLENFKMALSGNERHVYLNSSLINAFYLDAGKDGKVDNLKEIEIGYKYYDVLGEEVPEKSKVFAKDELIPVKSKTTGKYYFEIPVIPSESGRIEISARLHRTKEIQDAYTAGEFSILETATVETSEISIKISEYSDFFNNYIRFFDLDDNDYDELRNAGVIKEDGSVKFNKLSAVRNSLDYVFVKTSATIEVIDAVIESMSSAVSYTAPDGYDVSESVTYDLKELIDEYHLGVTFTEESSQNTFTSSDYSYFGNLVLTPAMYISKENFALLVEQSGNVWSEFDTYGVNELTTDDTNPKNITSTTITPNTSQDSYKGYLIKLNKTVAGRVNYFTITKNEEYVDGIPSWTFKFNVPKENAVGDNLLVMFELTSKNPSTGETKYSYDFTRISIGYTESSEIMTIDNLHKNMTINSHLSPSASTGYKDTQYISISDNASSDSTYKNVMYFVEKSSNSDDGGQAGVAAAGDEAEMKKVVAVGEYSFEMFDGSPVNIAENEGLIGERIPTYDSVAKKFFIKPLNVTHGEEVKFFAVKYLSDEDGNPINKYGQIINLSTEKAQLVIVNISEYSEDGMPSCSIECFADRVNYYTINNEEGKAWEITDDNGGVQTLTFVGKRNYFDDNYAENAELFKSMKTVIDAEISLKFLYNMQLTVYVSNLDLVVNKDGTATASLPTNTISVAKNTLVSPNGEPFADGLVFSQDNGVNQLKAFNDTFKDYSLVYNSEHFNVSPVAGGEGYIKFLITANKPAGLNTSSSFSMAAPAGQVYSTTLNSDYNKVGYSIFQVKPDEVTLNDVSNYGNSITVNYKQSIDAINDDPNKLIEFKDAANTNNDFKLEVTEGKFGTTTEYTSLLINNNGQDVINRNKVDFSLNNDELVSFLATTITAKQLTSSSIAQKVYLLEDDLKFRITDGYLYIADKTVAVDGTKVTLQKRDFNILTDADDSKYIKVDKGELLPAREENDAEYVYLLGYKFEIQYVGGAPCIYSETIIGSKAGITSDIVFENSLGEKTEYKNSNYFQSDTPLNADGSIDFTYGEEKFIVKKTINGEEETIADHDGVYAFMLVTTRFEFVDGIFEKVNVIRFNIFQEDIEIKAKNGENSDIAVFDNSESNIQDANCFTINSDLFEIKIQNGNGGGSNNFIYLDTTNIESNYFMNHVKLSIVGESGAPFYFEEGGRVTNEIVSENTNPLLDRTLNIKSQPSIYSQYAILAITYKSKANLLSEVDDDPYITKYIKIKKPASPSFKFEIADNEKVGTVEGGTNYKIIMTSNMSIKRALEDGDPAGQALWSQYFNMPSGYYLKLTSISGDACKLADDNANILSKRVFVSSTNNDSVTMPSCEYKMELTNGDHTIEINTNLTIVVVPAYIVKVQSGLSSKSFVAGDKILGNIIEIYSYDYESESMTKLDYASNEDIYNYLVISLKAKIGENDEDVLDGNIVSYTGSDDVKATLSVGFNMPADEQNNLYADNAINATYTNITIKGIKISYDENGDIENNSGVVLENEVQTIEIIAKVNKQVNLAGYFKLNLGSGYYVAVIANQRGDGDDGTDISTICNSYVYVNRESTSKKGDVYVTAGTQYIVHVINSNDEIIATFANIKIEFVQAVITVTFDPEGVGTNQNADILPNEAKSITLTAVDGKINLNEYFAVTSTSGETIYVGIKVTIESGDVAYGGEITLGGDIVADNETEYELCVYDLATGNIIVPYNNVKVKFISA